jgi:RNase P/RNase MRP subunit POP5
VRASRRLEACALKHGCGALVRSFNSRTGYAVIRAPRDHVRMVWTALTFLTRVKKHLVIATVRCNAGSERSAVNKLEKLDPDLSKKLAAQLSR